MRPLLETMTVGLALVVAACSATQSDTFALNSISTVSTQQSDQAPASPSVSSTPDSNRPLNVGAATSATEPPGIPTIGDTATTQQPLEPNGDSTDSAPRGHAVTTVAVDSNNESSIPAAVDYNCPNGLAGDLPLALLGTNVPGDTGLGIASSPEIQRNPCGTVEEKACFDAVNAERQALSLAPYIWDGDLADLGRSHSADMEQLDYFSHGSSNTDQHLYQERGEKLGLKQDKFVSVVEVIATNNSGGHATVQLFMGSAEHRAVIIGEGGWSNITHMACGHNGDSWTIEFAW